MTTDRTSQTSMLYDAVRRALLNEWDPIGVSNIAEAHDEYDSYVPEICRMLIAHKPKSQIFDYLWRLETEHIGLTGDRQATENFASRLIQISNSIEESIKKVTFPPYNPTDIYRH